MPGIIPIAKRKIIQFRRSINQIFMQGDRETFIFLEKSYQELTDKKENLEALALYEIALVLAIAHDKNEVATYLLERDKFNIDLAFQVDFYFQRPAKVLPTYFRYPYPFVPICRTILAHAAFQGRLKMVKFLVETMKADINAPSTLTLEDKENLKNQIKLYNEKHNTLFYLDESTFERTPLHEAVLGDGNTHLAFGREHALVAKYLLSHGAHLKKMDNSKKTPYDYSDTFFTKFSLFDARTVHPILKQYKYFQDSLKPRIETKIDSIFLSYYAHKKDSGYTIEVVKIITDYLNPMENPMKYEPPKKQYREMLGLLR